MTKKLIILLGPTGVGKTDLSIKIANYFHTSIVSCDSRQIYKEMKIGTAVPEEEQLQAVKHYFIQSISAREYYNSWKFEEDALETISKLHKANDVVLMTGGSMMYIDAVCNGIDDIPTISSEIRNAVMKKYAEEGLESIQAELLQLDPDFYNEVDLNNAKRVMHAIEICRESGTTYSSLRTNSKKKRPFEIIKIGLKREREELYDRINRRVDIMIKDGLEKEARALYHLKNINSLNTVGYKELFEYFDGNIDYKEAVRLIKRNSRRYAKHQMTWFRKDEAITWFNPEKEDEILSFLKEKVDF